MKDVLLSGAFICGIVTGWLAYLLIKEIRKIEGKLIHITYEVGKLFLSIDEKKKVKIYNKSSSSPSAQDRHKWIIEKYEEIIKVLHLNPNTGKVNVAKIAYKIHAEMQTNSVMKGANIPSSATVRRIITDWRKQQSAPTFFKELK